MEGHRAESWQACQGESSTRQNSPPNFLGDHILTFLYDQACEQYAKEHFKNL